MGKLILFLYRSFGRFKTKIFSILIGKTFAKFDAHSTIVPPLRLYGSDRIHIGKNVFIGSGGWLEAIDNGNDKRPAIIIGDNTKIAGRCVITAIKSVILESDVLLASNIYISDNSHKYSDTSVPISKQGIDKISPVLIKRNSWIGQNVVIAPGVTIGAGSVVGANSFVNIDVPDYTIAAGCPARIIKEIDRR